MKVKVEMRQFGLHPAQSGFNHHYAVKSGNFSVRNSKIGVRNINITRSEQKNWVLNGKSELLY